MNNMTSFPTHRFSTLTKISGHLKGIISINIINIIILSYVYQRFQLATCNWNVWAAICFSGCPYMCDNYCGIRWIQFSVFNKLTCIWQTIFPKSASGLAQHSSLFEPGGTVNYDYIVTNSINSLLVGSRCIVFPMVHTLSVVEPI